MTVSMDASPRQLARFVVMYDTPSDFAAFERHYNESTSRWRNSIRACVASRAAMSRQL
jgi:hypothetical protein